MSDFKQWYDEHHKHPMPTLWRSDIDLATRAWDFQQAKVEELTAKLKQRDFQDEVLEETGRLLDKSQAKVEEERCILEMYKASAERRIKELDKSGTHFGEFIEIIWPLTALKSRILEKHPEYADIIAVLKESE